MQIHFLTEGGRVAGFGHLVRCYSLAQALAHYGFPVRFHVRGDESASRILGDMPHSFTDWTERGSPVPPADAYILDSYTPDPFRLREIADTGALLLCVDDYQRTQYPGIVLNGSLYAPALDYGDAPETWLGPRYTLLRQPFWEGMPEDQTRSGILLTLGGSLSPELERTLCETIQETLPGMPITLIGALRAFPGVTVLGPQSAAEMRMRMAQHHIAICGAGQTLHELAATGTPSIGLMMAANQRLNLEAWSGLGITWHGGPVGHPGLPGRIREGLLHWQQPDVWEAASRHARQVLDGRGSLRVARKLLIRLTDREPVILPAEPEDALEVLRISNQKAVRASSFQTEPIQENVHIEWFERQLSRPDVLFLTLWKDQTLRGQIRFAVSGHQAMVSISTDQEVPLPGMAAMLMQRGLRLLRSRYPGVEQVLAQIKTENERSRRFFEKMGFAWERDVILNDTPSVEHLYRY